MVLHVPVVSCPPAAPPTRRIGVRARRTACERTHAFQQRHHVSPQVAAAAGSLQRRQLRRLATDGAEGYPAGSVSLQDASLHSSNNPRHPDQPGSQSAAGDSGSSSSAQDGQDQQAASLAAASTAEAEGAQARQQHGGEGLRLAPAADTVVHSQQAEQQQQQQLEQPGSPWQLRWQLPEVPWALNTTITIMVLWLCCFLALNNSAVPALLRWSGIQAASKAAGAGSAASAAEAAARLQVVRHLLLETLQVVTTMLLLRRSLGRYKPRQLGLFATPFWPLRRWLLAVAAGLLTFPVIDWVYHRVVLLLPAAEEYAISQQVVSSSSWETSALWFGVLVVCSPIWEEHLFRGFLLPSLAKYLPRWAAIAVTSLIFACMHFHREGMLALLLLGAVFGAAYAYTQNLLAPIVLHSLWNASHLVLLLGGSGGAL